MADETLADARAAADRVDRARQPAQQVELAPVVRWLGVVAAELQVNIPKRLIALLLPAEPVLRDEIGYLGVLSLAHPPHHLVEILSDIDRRQIAHAGFAGVERVVVQLDPFLIDAPVQHRANAAVAERERLDPLL